MSIVHCLFKFQNPNPEKENPPCNAQELEECDAFLEDSASLCRFDGDTLKVTHVVSAANYYTEIFQNIFYDMQLEFYQNKNLCKLLKPNKFLP